MWLMSSSFFIFLYKWCILCFLGMREACWLCKKYEEHIYWDHFEESKFRFLKVMDGDFSPKMEFPLKFSKNFRVDLIDVVSLKSPTGRSWDIDLQKDQDHFYFIGGWKQFIEENKVEHGQTLIFEYRGDSSFMVQFFNQTGCIRVAPGLVIDDPAEKKKADRTFQTSNSEVRDDNPMLNAVSGGRPTSTRRACGDERRVGSSGSCNQELNYLNSGSSLETNSSHGNSQDPVEVLQLKFAGKQSKSSFVKIIKRSNLYRNPYMTIPNKFLSGLPRKPYGITIYNQSNKKWFVLCKWMNTAWGFYGRSLLNLMQENKLKEGDACVFKLKERKKTMAMEMSIVLAKEVDSVLKNFWS